ncbi:MAG: hypothetical protein M0Z54_03405 [Thermaerobacter sp.]|nr:hypothetical protein [Thermaerobacter sp.]
MGRREFTRCDGLDIWEHWHAADSLGALERNLGVDRHTLRKYVALAEAAGCRPGQPGATRAAWQVLYRETFPQRTPALPARALLTPYQDRIVAGLAINTVTTVWRRRLSQRLRPDRDPPPVHRHPQRRGPRWCGRLAGIIACQRQTGTGRRQQVQSQRD